MEEQAAKPLRDILFGRKGGPTGQQIHAPCAPSHTPQQNPTRTVLASAQHSPCVPRHTCRPLVPQHIDFVGLITALLAIHLSEPAGIRGMNPHVLTMLGCLEHAFAHFESAKRGRLDRREVETALLEESSKVATRDGKHAATKTGHRLASKLFKSIGEARHGMAVHWRQG